MPFCVRIRRRARDAFPLIFPRYSSIDSLSIGCPGRNLPMEVMYVAMSHAGPAAGSRPGPRHLYIGAKAGEPQLAAFRALPGSGAAISGRDQLIRLTDQRPELIVIDLRQLDAYPAG